MKKILALSLYLATFASATYAQNYRYEHVDIKTKEEDPFFRNKHNNYIGGGFYGGYPFTFGFSGWGRHGGIVGVGYYLSFGSDVGEIFDVTPLSYSVGLKLFPYKSIFLSAGYGTLGVKKMTAFNDSNGRWGTDGWRQGKGVTFIGGYDILSKNDGSGCTLFSIGVGMSYDMFLEKWSPMVSLRLGAAK